jgi:hypothetical protein
MNKHTVTYDNRKDLDSLYFHDCCFEGFTYDYEAHRITISVHGAAIWIQFLS